MSSADTTPIAPARFAAALKDLSVAMLHLKVLEIRNSIAHLQYSNDQLRPFADGSATASDGSTAAGEPDQDCVDAIRENEHVVERMAERIALVRIEVEERGVSWDEFASKEGTDAAVARAREERQRQVAAAAQQRGEEEEVVEDVTGVAGQVNGATSPWTDGTFQTGTIRNGEVHMDAQPAARTNGAAAGGSLSDEQLRAAVEERMRQLTTDDDDRDEDGGMHL